MRDNDLLGFKTFGCFQLGGIMTEEPKKEYIFTPEVVTWAPVNGKQTEFHLPVPKGQEWLFAALDQQTHALNGINNKLTYIVIIIALGLIFIFLRGCAGA